jgi:uncharacterized damage-inducible protein DinB
MNRPLGHVQPPRQLTARQLTVALEQQEKGEQAVGFHVRGKMFGNYDRGCHICVGTIRCVTDVLWRQRRSTLSHHTTVPAFSITTAALLEHWQGHRRVTRRVIQAFPDAELFTFSVGGMRPFSQLAFEMISMADAGTRGIATGTWAQGEGLMHHGGRALPDTRESLLALWDQTTAVINDLWGRIPPARFQEVDTAFGTYEGVMYGLLLYWIDNEVHHRGQGYVYLRALGIQHPAFYDRS